MGRDVAVGGTRRTAGVELHGSVEKTYADTTSPQQSRIDEPGLTAMYSVELVKDRLE